MASDLCPPQLTSAQTALVTSISIPAWKLWATGTGLRGHDSSSVSLRPMPLWAKPGLPAPSPSLFWVYLLPGQPSQLQPRGAGPSKGPGAAGATPPSSCPHKYTNTQIAPSVIDVPRRTEEVRLRRIQRSRFLSPRGRQAAELWRPGDREGQDVLREGW